MSNSNSNLESDSESSELSISSDELIEQFDNLDLQGKILNKYNIIYEIGKGADAIVWLAFSIEDSKFYAIKVNEPKEYKKGLNEFNFIKKLPIKLKCFNHLKESFVEQKEDKKYSCGVFELHTGNLDSLVRSGIYQEGLPVKIVKKIMYQLLTALKYLHKQMKVYHADIKTDNILLKGYNDYDELIMKQYIEFDFFSQYKEAKKIFWLGKGKPIETLEKMKKEDKLKIREITHQLICEKINFPDKELKNIIKENYINESNISLANFGAFCGENEHYDCEFGTRYYRAPEIILMGTCGIQVDIWAAGCVFYELLTGRILFDPEKCSNYNRDAYHLYHINRHMGNFPIGFLKKTKYWKNYFDSKGQLEGFEIELRLFKDKFNNFNVIEQQDEIINLLQGMLTISPNQRFDADKCLSHSFFKGTDLD